MSSSDYFKKREVMQNRAASADPAPRSQSNDSRKEETKEEVKLAAALEVPKIDVQKLKAPTKKLVHSGHLEKLKAELGAQINSVHGTLTNLLKTVDVSNDLFNHKNETQKKSDEVDKKIGELHERLRNIENLIEDD